MIPGGLLRRGFLLAYFSYHAIAWYVVHAVGRGHGGENIAAAVVVFLPYAMLSWASLGSRWTLCLAGASAQYEKTSACAPACLPGAFSPPLPAVLRVRTACDVFSQF